MLRISLNQSHYRGARAALQDTFAATSSQNETFVCHGGQMSVVADGHGIKGTEAAKRAVQVMVELYQRKRPEEHPYTVLERSLHEANRIIYELYGRDGIGFATMIAIVVVEGQLYWISCGNSRLYICRDGHLTRLTQDHIYGIELYDRVCKGLLDLDEADQHPHRLRLTSYLGMPTLPKVEKNSSSFLMKAGDRLLLCTDGLYESLTKKEIQRLLAKYTNPAKKLIAKVREKNIPDQGNATAVCLTFDLNDWDFRFGPFGLSEKVMYAGVASLLLLVGTGIYIW